MRNRVRIFVYAAAAFLIFLSLEPARAGSSLVGTWQTVLSVDGTRCSMQSIYERDGSYSELLRCGSLMTHQAGTYVLRGDLLVRNVEDWAPKQQWVVGACVGCGHWQTTAKPPGGSYRVDFLDANTATLHDLNLGGTVTMHRASQ
ncbi:MAG TPA: hypothetical protein VEJ41_10055 [Candidatus Acidoferrales bacterium]|nr:hypothetical protein [Candidatus Acidoferrales bacterium]